MAFARATFVAELYILLIFLSTRSFAFIINQSWSENLNYVNREREGSSCNSKKWFVVNLNRYNKKSSVDSRRIRRISIRTYMSTNTDLDFYTLLGISRNADPDDIKQAYWKMAKKLHPDASANKNRKDATERFQEVNRAYEVLKDRDLKRKYDMRGKSGIGTSASSDTGSDNIWKSYHGKPKAKKRASHRCSPYDSFGNSHFGNGGSTYGSYPNSGSNKESYDCGPFTSNTSKPNRKSAYGPTGFSHSNPGEVFENEAYPSGSAAKTTADEKGEVAKRGPVTVGDDLRADLEINKHTAKFGGVEKVTIQQLERCNSCVNGVKPGSDVSPCNVCDGTGVVTTSAKNKYPYQKPPKCSACNGTGKHIKEYCESCAGKGLVTKTKDIKIVIPKSVKQTHTVFVSGAGNAGPNGGPHGDLYIFLRVNPNLKDPMPEEEIENEKEFQKVVEMKDQKIGVGTLNDTTNTFAQNMTEVSKMKTNVSKKIKTKKSYKSKSKKHKQTKNRHQKVMKP